MDLGPYAKMLGFTVEETRTGAVCRMKYDPALLGSTALHGGTIAALLKEAAVLAVLARGQSGRQPALVSLTTRFLRAGRQQDTFASGTVSRNGARVVNVEVAAWQDDRERPVASAQASFVLE